MSISALKPGSFNAATKQISLAKNNVSLPFGVTLHRGRVHEITGLSGDGFAASILAMLSGPIVWVGRGQDVYSICPLSALSFFDPARLVTTECNTRKDILWAAEQALRSKGSDCVVVQMFQGPNLRESRRFQLAAEEGRTLGLILIEKSAQSSAAQTRWDCNPLPKTDLATNAHTWEWKLIKNKAGKAGCWQVRWRDGLHATRHVHMVSPASS